MNYKLNLKIPAKEGLKELIESDGLDFGDRSSAKITREKDSLNLTIDAEDATSLRASINSVVKVLQVYEKSDGV